MFQTTNQYSHSHLRLLVKAKPDFFDVLNLEMEHQERQRLNTKQYEVPGWSLKCFPP